VLLILYRNLERIFNIVVCKIKLEKNKKPFVIAFLLNIPNQKKGNHK